MKDKTKNILIGALIAVVVVFLLSSIKGTTTGNTVKTLNTGMLDVNPGISADYIDIYVDNTLITTLKRGDQDEYITLEAGKHILRAVTEGYDDSTKEFVIEAGKTTKVYPWSDQKAIIS